MSLSQSLIDDLAQEGAASRRLLEVIPEDKFAWQPHEKSMPLRRLAGHVADLPLWGVEMVRNEVFDFATASENFTPFDPETRGELLDGFDLHLTTLTQLLDGKDDAFLETVWTMKRGAETMMALPRHVALRTWVLRHVVHHRGQLSVFLRLLGVPLPRIYGPTADAQGFD